jgi:hypothetical protein
MEVLTKCQIFHIESGQKIADGVGFASTLESKYRWRNAARKCPVCGKETIIQGKKEYGGGYVCFGKKGGCGAKFKDDDPAITSQTAGKVENIDIADTYNTVIKMSKKRAYVDATITACAASDIFSQDAEDFHAEPNGDYITPPVKTSETRQEVLADTANILKTLSPDGLPFFSGTEITQERAIAGGTANVDGLKKQQERLRKTLEKRKAEYKPIPFGDAGESAPYAGTATVQEDRTAEFEDDIPAGKEPAYAGEEIF